MISSLEVFQRNIVYRSHLLHAVRNILFNMHAVQRPHFILGPPAPGHDIGTRFHNDSSRLLCYMDECVSCSTAKQHTNKTAASRQPQCVTFIILHPVGRIIKSRYM
jgi:hypothetical protein